MKILEAPSASFVWQYKINGWGFLFYLKILLQNLLTTILVAAFCMGLQAQSIRVNDPNNHAWIVYTGVHKISPKWALHLEAQPRRSELGKGSQQLLLRTGINYAFSKQVSATTGYCFVETYPYGEFLVSKQFSEHRLWQQLQTSNNFGRVEFINRYRLEQRWIGSSTFGGFQSPYFANRVRYLGRVNIPLNKPSNEKGTYYLSLYDEIFIGFGKQVKANIFDQNRACALLGYNTGKWGKLELGYMLQILQQRNGIVFEHNNTLMVSFASSVQFFKTKR